MRSFVAILGLALLGAPAAAGTFDKAPIAPEYGVDALTRGVAREKLGRNVFANPYATVTLGTVDVYDKFPYVEARRFQVVSDPSWNRLVFGEAGRSLAAYDGAGTALGALKEPRGLAVDEQNRVYVADSGNDRVVVLQASTEFGRITLTPLFDVRGLGEPYAVAVSDAGTPFDPSDDRLYVANTGKNEIVAFALEGNSARRTGSIGTLGSADGCFAGPMAIAVGRKDGVQTTDLYVADAHNRRIVRLVDRGASLAWAGEERHEADVVTSLDTDPWGNVYAAAPNKDAVYKFNPSLEPVARLAVAGARPKSFHVPYLTVNDHRTGTVVREGQAKGLAVESWTDTDGLKLWNLGIEVADLAVVQDERPAARFTLTDQAKVAFEVKDATSGRTISRRDLGTLAAGAHAVPLEAAEAGAGQRVLRVTASSSYASGPSDVSEALYATNANGAVLPPAKLAFLGGLPNPMRSSVRMSFLVPANPRGPVSLQLVDARGRLVRRFPGTYAPGLNEVTWDGRDERGSRVAPGVYFTRVELDGDVSTGRLVVIGQ